MTDSSRTLVAAPAAPVRPADPPPTRTLPTWAAPAALGVILVLATVLYGWALGSLGWGNGYYSAAVKSMGKSWTNFLFGAYDAAGVVTVDKPPASLWPQVISTKIFGFHGWSLILPQTIEGVAGVFVLHRTVRRWAGEPAALLSALVLTLTPITVAINRDNNPDTLLVLLLVSAAYALTRALQSAEGRTATRWLCLCAFLIGCGFLTKMMAAWMVVPAFALAWLMGASGTWAQRIRRLLGAGAVLLVSSLWWVAMVQWWPGDKPYIGGSEDGSAWNLVIGYNGLGRLFGSSGGTSQSTGFSGAFGGSAGIGRLFNSQVGGQISWLLPACGVALAVAVACVLLRRRGKLGSSVVLPSSHWLLWGTWLIVCAAVFSTQEGIFHPYYTTLLAPAIAGLMGGLLAALIRLHRAGVRWATAAGAGTVLVTAIWAVVIIRRTPDWNGWLVWPVLIACCAAVVLLLVRRFGRRMLMAGVGAAVVTMLLAPTAWSISSTAGSGSPMGGSNPTAGPSSMQGPGSGGMSGGMSGGDMPDMGDIQGMEGMEGMPSGGSGGQEMPSMGSGGSGSGGMSGGGGSGDTELTANQKNILAYVVKNAPDARIKLAVEGGANATNAFILNTDETVIGMGGFTTTDDVPSTDQLEEWTKSGELRYILASDYSNGTSDSGVPGSSGGASDKRAKWISENCTKVDASEYGGTESSGQSGASFMGMGSGTVLYDCAAK